MTQGASQKDLDAVEAIRHATEEEIKEYQTRAKDEAEMLARFVLKSS